jgi:aminoglycoside phosphotransferase
VTGVEERLEREGVGHEEVGDGAWRLERDGARALVLSCGGTERAARAALLHGPVVGEQLFVVPDLIEVWGDEHAVVVEDPGGALGADAPWTGPYATQHAEQLGEALRKLHSLQVTERTFGDVREGGARWSTFNGFAAARLESHLVTVNHDDALEPGAREELLRTLDDLRHELSAFHPRYPAVWCHGSPGQRRVLVDGARVTGLVGFEEASFLPGEWDLACVLYLDGLVAHDALVRALYRGYGAARTMDMQRRERFFRRLVSLEAMFGGIPSRRTTAELIAMAGPRA